MKLYLQNYGVVAPGVWGKEGLGNLSNLGSDDQPEIKFQLDFVKPAQRRRLSYTTKLALQAAFLTGTSESLAKLPTVFVSRHGELANTSKILDDLEADEIPSPTQFIHSVHGTAAGAFSILLENREASITLSNQAWELTPALFEVAGLLSAGEAEEVLVVVFDAPVSGKYADYVTEPRFPYAVALRFNKKEGDIALDLVESDVTQSPEEVKPLAPFPQALEFIQWLSSSEPSFSLLAKGGWDLIKAK